MTEFLVLCGLAVLVSLAIVFGVRRWALRNMLDLPNERSSHVIPTPRGGGLSIVLTTSILFITSHLSGMVSTEGFTAGVGVFIGVSILVALLGWFDDLYTLSAKMRLLLQAAAAGVTIVAVGSVTDVEAPLLGIVSFTPLVAFFINMFWVVGFTNIYNFMDGIDGLAGSQAVIAGLGWGALLLAIGERELALFALLLASSSLGFLFLNRPRALIFMGDVGSTFLGFCLALLPLLIFARVGDARLLGAGILLVAPFALDGGFTILRRALRGENVLEAHRSHIYQRLIKQGYSHLQITGLYTVYNLVSAGCALLYYVAWKQELGIAAVVIPVALFVLLAVWTSRLERANRQVEIASATH